MNHPPQNIIIIGGTSGIGRELARLYVARGAAVTITGRRKHLLDEIQKQLGPTCTGKYMDISDDAQARKCFADIVENIDPVDIVILSAAVGELNPENDWQIEKHSIDINTRGFAAMANAAFKYFLRQGTGHLVGISSIAALRGGEVPAYYASKAFVRNYLQSLRKVAGKQKARILVTEIMPGLVNTRMAKGEGLFWVAPVEKAAVQIMSAIDKKKEFAYVTRRWRLAAWLIKLLPDFLYNRI